MSEDYPRKASTSLIDHLVISEEQRQRLRATKSPSIKGNIPLEERFNGQTLEILSVDRSNYTHGFHKFPASDPFLFWESSPCSGSISSNH